MVRKWALSPCFRETETGGEPGARRCPARPSRSPSCLQEGTGRQGWGLGWSLPCSGSARPHPCPWQCPPQLWGCWSCLLPCLSPGPHIQYHFLKPPLCRYQFLYCFHGNNPGALLRPLPWEREGPGPERGAVDPGTHSCARRRPAGLPVCARPVGEEVSGSPSARPGRWEARRQEPDKAGQLPAEGAASGAWPPAWARPGAGAQLSASPPPPPSPRTHAGKSRLWGLRGAWGLAGWDPRERIHSNELSEDWVPVGPRLLLARA